MASDEYGSGIERFVVTQCTASKRDEQAPAADLYDTSAYFRAQRSYAQAADAWAIQSAKHQLLWPGEEVHPYDTRPSDIDDLAYWAYGIADEIEYAVGADTTVEILGGAAYADPLTPELEQRGFEVKEPLRGLKIGERMARLAELTEQQEVAPR